MFQAAGPPLKPQPRFSVIHKFGVTTSSRFAEDAGCGSGLRRSTTPNLQHLLDIGGGDAKGVERCVVLDNTDFPPPRVTGPGLLVLRYVRRRLFKRLFQLVDNRFQFIPGLGGSFFFLSSAAFSWASRIMRSTSRIVGFVDPLIVMRCSLRYPYPSP